MPSHSPVCRPDDSTDLCLQNRFHDNPQSADQMTPDTAVCSPDATCRPLSEDPMPSQTLNADLMPHRPCLLTGCSHRPLSADGMPAQTPICRTDAPEYLCLQTHCPQQTSVSIPDGSVDSVCRPEAPVDLCLHTRCPHRPQSADAMTPLQTSFCRPDAPSGTLFSEPMAAANICLENICLHNIYLQTIDATDLSLRT